MCKDFLKFYIQIQLFNVENKIRLLRTGKILFVTKFDFYQDFACYSTFSQKTFH
jgi:hypothetical protein